MELVAWNVVLVANKFNPSIFTSFWLVKNQVVDEQHLETPSISTDAVSQIQTKEFFLAVFPELLQFSPRVPADQEAALIESKVWRIVSALPETPYTGIGVNFFWHLTPDGETMPDFTRRLFFNAASPLCQDFDVPDAHFGGYFSKDGSHGTRMKLDIKPIIINAAGSAEGRLQFGFNFHRDLNAETRLEDIRNVLGMWDEAKRVSESTIKKATKK